MKPRKWTAKQLKKAVSDSTSIRQVLSKLGLKEAGGNYSQIKKYIRQYNLDSGHFKGRGWSRGLKGIGKPRIKINEILVKDSDFQSFKLKKRLFSEKIKNRKCEECGWSKRSKDGRIPLELHHINGDSRDNRLKNLQILCPNCHSLKPNHRGRGINKS